MIAHDFFCLSDWKFFNMASFVSQIKGKKNRIKWNKAEVRIECVSLVDWPNLLQFLRMWCYRMRVARRSGDFVLNCYQHVSWIKVNDIKSIVRFFKCGLWESSHQCIFALLICWTCGINRLVPWFRSEFVKFLNTVFLPIQQTHQPNAEDILFTSPKISCS